MSSAASFFRLATQWSTRHTFHRSPPPLFRHVASRTFTNKSLSRGFASSQQQPPQQPLQQRRCWSAESDTNHTTDNPYKSLQYPMAKEPPEIICTTAAEANKISRSHQKQVFPKQKSFSSFRNILSNDNNNNNNNTEDRFDDQHNLTDAQVQERRQLQKQQLNTTIRTPHSDITPIIPQHIPPNVPADQLAVPETIVTQLDNGVRVVSQETYGQVSTVGVVSQLGSRHEQQPQGNHQNNHQNTNTGVTHLLETLAFGATQQYSGAQIKSMIQDWGGQQFVTTGREQSLHCIDLLRPNMEQALVLLQQVLLEPQFLPQEVEEAQKILEFQAMDFPLELTLGEALQAAAYGSDEPQSQSQSQQLGQAHFCVPAVVPQLTVQAAHDFWNRQFIQNPQGLVFAGAGVQHDVLVRNVEMLFGHMKQDDTLRVKDVPSTYRGGEHRVVRKALDDEGLIHMAVGFEVGGWYSDELVAICVLQTLLGGGSSFSAGGPGKGMYSRLYRQVLNRYKWAESTEAYTRFHNESGVWGITGSARPERARDMVKVFTEHLAKLAVELVSDEELDRARNMLKCNVLTQLESRLVLFEDMGRQVLTYGHRECMNVTCEKIMAVEKEELRQVVIKALQKPPTIAAVGEDLTHVPHQDEVVRWLSQS